MGTNENNLSDLATFNRRHFRKHYFFEKLSVHGVKQIQILSTTSSRQHQNILDSTKNIFEILVILRPFEVGEKTAM